VSSCLIASTKTPGAGSVISASLWQSSSGSVLRTSQPARWFDDAAAAIEASDLTPYGTRHTAASLAVSAGANVKSVQRMLGHASAAVTLDVYADLFDDDLDAVGRRLDRVARTARRKSAVDQVRRSRKSWRCRRHLIRLWPNDYGSSDVWAILGSNQ
jgi:hypothetical protein